MKQICPSCGAVRVSSYQEVVLEEECQFCKWDLFNLKRLVMDFAKMKGQASPEKQHVAANVG